MKKRNILSLFLVLIIFTTIVKAQWTQVNNPPVYFYTSHFAQVGSNVVLLNQGSSSSLLAISSNGGLNWTAFPKPDSLYFYLIKSFGSDLYGFAYSTTGLSNKLFIVKTTNNGVNWTYINTRIDYSIYYTPRWLQDIFINNNGIYVGEYCNGYYPNAGLWYTSNNGANWVKLSDATLGTNYVYITKVVVSGNNIFVTGDNSVYQSFKSTNHGLNWTSAPLPAPLINDLVLTPGGTLLASSQTSAQIYRSTNFGSNWQTITSPGTGPQRFSITGSTIYLGSSQGIVAKSTDDGVNWTTVSTFPQQCNLAFSPGGSNLLAATAWGTYYSSNNGTSWTRLYFPLNYFSVNPSGVYVNSLSINGNTLYAGTPSGLFKSTNSGTNWTHIGPDHWVANAVYNDGTNLYVGVDSLTPNGFIFGSGLYVTTNDGVNWTKAMVPSSSLSFITKFGTVMFASGVSSFLYRSTDNGYNWSQVSSGVSGLASSGTALFGIQGSNSVIRSTNNGLNWSNVMFNSTLSAIGGTTGNIYVSSQSNGLQRSTNNGISWLLTGFYMPTSVILADNNNIVTGGSSNVGVHFSSDYGVNWFPRNDGFGSNLPYNVYQFILSNNTLYAVTTPYIWKRPYNEVITGVTKLNNTLPVKYQLYQNYPNPFNPKTKIKFDLVKSSNVKLEIYDINGRHIKTLVNSLLQSGTYETEFDATALPSGIYFYKLITDGFEKTNKMMLIK